MSNSPIDTNTKLEDTKVMRKTKSIGAKSIGVELQ